MDVENSSKRQVLGEREAIQVDNELSDQCVTTTQHSISTASQQPSENVL